MIGGWIDLGKTRSGAKRSSRSGGEQKELMLTWKHQFRVVTTQVPERKTCSGRSGVISPSSLTYVLWSAPMYVSTRRLIDGKPCPNLARIKPLPDGWN